MVRFINKKENGGCQGLGDGEGTKCQFGGQRVLGRRWGWSHNTKCT